MRFLIMTDIEGVTGVTSFPQAECSEFGKQMLMHDLNAVIAGIKAEGEHEIVVYDMHTDGRNVDISQLPEDIPVIMGKPISRTVYRGAGGNYDGLFLLGLHTMQHVPGALLAHSYLREYDSIHLNGILVGEIGVEAALAGQQGFPLVFVSGDDLGCAEAKQLVPEVVTAAVKTSIDEAQALCPPPAKTGKILFEAAREAVRKAKFIPPFKVEGNVEVKVKFSQCHYRNVMQKIHPEIFTDVSTACVSGEGMLDAWGKYLLLEREMLQNA